MFVTRVIGTKIFRRPKTSATRPSTRGWCTSERTATTRSRTLPTWSPWGSKIGSPTSRAAYTRAGVVLTMRHATGVGGTGDRPRVAPRRNDQTAHASTYTRVHVENPWTEPPASGPAARGALRVRLRELRLHGRRRVR